MQLGYYFEQNFTLILNMHIFLRTELPNVFYRDFEFWLVTFTVKSTLNLKKKIFSPKILTY